MKLYFATRVCTLTLYTSVTVKPQAIIGVGTGKVQQLKGRQDNTDIY